MRYFVLSLLVWCAGCQKSATSIPPPRPAAATVLEATQLIDSYQTNVIALTNIATFKSAADISRSLETFTAATKKWEADYMIMRAKMMVKGVTPAEEQSIVERYQRVQQQTKAALTRLSDGLRARSDLQTFETELKRANETLNSLSAR
jgi:hypothetical protein